MTYTGAGHWPGTDYAEALAIIFDELSRPSEPDPAGEPFVPHLPDRGPGADDVGNAAAMLVDMHVDLQPHGWRVTQRPSLDEKRADQIRFDDMDRLLETAEDHRGRLKVQALGPWSLAAGLSVYRGDRMIGDTGARRDLTESYAEGLTRYLAQLQSLLPGADLVVQLDEPHIVPILDGSLPTASGFNRIPAVSAREIETGLAGVIDGIRAGTDRRVILDVTGNSLTRTDADSHRSLAALMADAGASGIATPVADMGLDDWEAIAEVAERGVEFRGVMAPAETAEVTAGVEAVNVPWRRVGLPTSALVDVSVVAASVDDAPVESIRAGFGYARGVARAIYEVALS